MFFGPLPAFRAEGVGMHPEGLGDAGAEAVGLNQCTNKRADVVNARAAGLHHFAWHPEQAAQALGLPGPPLVVASRVA